LIAAPGKRTPGPCSREHREGALGGAPRDARRRSERHLTAAVRDCRVAPQRVAPYAGTRAPSDTLEYHDESLAVRRAILYKRYFNKVGVSDPHVSACGVAYLRATVVGGLLPLSASAAAAAGFKGMGPRQRRRPSGQGGTLAGHRRTIAARGGPRSLRGSRGRGARGSIQKPRGVRHFGLETQTPGAHRCALRRHPFFSRRPDAPGAGHRVCGGAAQLRPRPAFFAALGDCWGSIRHEPRRRARDAGLRRRAAPARRRRLLAHRGAAEGVCEDHAHRRARGVERRALLPRLRRARAHSRFPRRWRGPRRAGPGASHRGRGLSGLRRLRCGHGDSRGPVARRGARDGRRLISRCRAKERCGRGENVGCRNGPRRLPHLVPGGAGGTRVYKRRGRRRGDGFVPAHRRPLLPRARRRGRLRWRAHGGVRGTSRPREGPRKKVATFKNFQKLADRQHTLPTFLVGLLFNSMRIPLARLLVPRYGVAGVWAAISLSTMLKAPAKYLCFRSLFEKGALGEKRA